jgi:hypothetical protein
MCESFQREGIPAELYEIHAKIDPSKAVRAAEWKQRLDALNKAPEP